MNESQQSFLATGANLSQTDKLINVLHRMSPEWVSMVFLGEEIGGWAVHSRVADARKRGCHIENRTEKDPITGKRHSFYRLLAP